MAYASGAIAQDATLKRIADALEVQSGSSEIIAPRENSSVSTHAYAIGEQFIYDGKLYKATAAIAIGDTIIPNTNCELSDTITEQIEQAGKVKGVKGNAESTYREGNVNLTPANIGAYSKSEVDTALNGKLGTSGASTNTTVAFTSNDLAANTTEKTNTTTNQPSTVAKLSSNETLASMFNKISSMFASIRKLWNTVGSTAIDTAYGATLTAQMANLKSYNTYSTSETWTGKYWIDGKKIYSASLYWHGAVSGAQNITLKTGFLSDSNPDKIINIEGCFGSSSGTVFYPLNYTRINNNNIHEFNMPQIDITNHNVTLNTYSSGTGGNLWSDMKIYLTVYYTKTTG